MSQNEKLIQNGFELIVRAFDDMERDCKEKVRMLEKKVNELNQMKILKHIRYHHSLKDYCPFCIGTESCAFQTQSAV